MPISRSPSNYRAHARNGFSRLRTLAEATRITNSIFTGTSLMGTQQLGSCTNYASASGVYQVAGAGGYYLPVGSADIDRGTPNITPELLSSLRAKTTSAPYIYASQMTSGVAIFQPQARREDGMPDRGYYYDPIDYAFGGVYWSNGIVTVTAGTVLAGCAEPPVSGRAAFGVGSGATFNTEGNPTNLVRIVRYNTVQEQSTDTWGGYFGPLLLTSWPTNLPPPQVNCRFTDFSAPAQDVELFRSCQANLQALPMNFKDCQFHGGRFNSDYPTINLTNCLLERVNCMLWQLDNNTPAIQNNLFYGGQLDFLPCTTTNAVIRDNLFDQVIIVDDLCGSGYRGGFNAYVTTNNGHFCSTYSADIILSSSPNYQVGLLGRFYQPTNSILINADTNTTAGSVGLYHYTVCTNFAGATQIKETNSWVDIGYHYVALDTNGAPVDRDLGGAPDYLEDANGNGTVDTGESDYTAGHGSDDWQPAGGGILAAEYLRCEYRQNPMGVETNYGPPRLYWVVKSGRRAQMQRAYQILVASSQNYLDINVGDMWNSGKVMSDATTHVDYRGSPLSSGQTLYWKVRSWDRYTDTSSAWSTNAFFQMGLLSTNDWNGANWIGVTGYQSGKPCPMFRSQPFMLTNQVKNATAYVSAKGLYELWINGYRIGPNVLAPEWTDYNVRIQYQTFDVGAYLTNGTPYSSNIIGAFVGEGWCYGDTDYGDYYGPRNPQFFLRLSITNTDLTSTNILTDANWSCSTNGPIRAASIFKGESYDARQEGATTNWCKAAYTPQSFTNIVSSSSVVVTQMFAQPNEPIQIIQYLQPIRMWTNTLGGQPVTIYDLGQNMVGWCALSLTNVANLINTEIKVRHSEILELNANNMPITNGNINPYNLANAFPALDTYTLNNDAKQQFHPHFTYHGFRYVEVAAPPSVATNLSLGSITGCVVRSGMPVTGAFWCSDTRKSAYATNLVSKLMTNASWGIRGNLQGVLTACTQRHEREGYLYDTMSQAACYDVDMAAFLTKWLRDIRETQRLRGDKNYTDFAPWDNLNITGGVGYSDPGAQGSALVYPWRLYQNYADTRMLAEQYRSVTNHISYLTSLCNSGGGPWKTTGWEVTSHVWDNTTAEVQDWGCGDYFGWGSGYTHPSAWPDGHAAGQMWRTWGTAWSAGSVDYAAKMAAVLQLEAQARSDSASAATYAADHTYFANVAAKVRTAYTNDLVQFNGSGTITAIWSSSPESTHGSWSSAQGDCMTALYFDMVPAGKRADVLSLLLNGPYGIVNYNSGFASNCTNHLSTGYYFAPRTMLELTRGGYSSKAYELLVDTNFPSWLYPVVNGATTFWEGWNSYLPGPNVYGSDRGYYPKAEPWNPFTSFNHGSYQGIAEWIWKVTGRINPDDTNPGFRSVILKPEPGGGITNTFASFASIHGPIVCTWTNNPSNSSYTLNVTNPANTTASVYIPSTNNLTGILESGRAAEVSPGVLSYYFTNWPNWANGATVFQVGSGGYSFIVTNISF